MNNNEMLTTLHGKTIASVTGLGIGSDSVEIHTTDDLVLEFYHNQDCCEVVQLNDYECTTYNFAGGIILSAEEITNYPEDTSDVDIDCFNDSYTWTFYKIDTTKGSLWMRWLGESNGYYSESVDIRIKMFN